MKFNKNLGILYFLSLLAVSISTGCSQEQKEEVRPTITRSMEKLTQKTMMPATPKAVAYQVGAMAPHGGDWWLAAIIEHSAAERGKFQVGPTEKKLINLPPGLQLTDEFKDLKQALSVNNIVDGDDIYAEAYSAEPYFKSPLYSGSLVKISEEKSLLLLYTM